MKRVRFRTLGCYPLSGAIESDADTLPKIIQEMLLATTSERQGRMIDHDEAASMEKKKQSRATSSGTAPTSIERDIDAYLEAHEHKSLLRFITCGSVDDGKSTLIGRLLYESQMLFEDQLAALEADSKRIGTQGDELDFALLLDGLAAEREQGITIDVAYRYFSTDTRKFIVADTPGHEQYTRNMVTGASTADCAVILIDARKGVLTQTRRHSYLVCAARHPPRRRRREQDGSRRLLRGALPRDRAPVRRVRRAARARGVHAASRSRGCAATTSSSAPTRCPGTTARR